MTVTIEAEDFSWLRQLARRLPGADAKIEVGDCQWPAYDLADIMEQGFAREMATHFMEAPALTESGQPVSRALTIERSEDRLEHTLKSEDGSALLVARSRREDRCIEFHLAGTGISNREYEREPSFRLAYTADKKVWDLYYLRCPGCEYRSPSCLFHRGRGEQRLLRARQDKVAIGKGSAFGVEAEVPGPGEVWCEACSGGRSPSSPEGTTLVSSRLPRWSAQMQSLTMEFKGRCNAGSAKNFQMVLGDKHTAAKAQGSDVMLQYGKMANGEFCLDVANTLSIVQAFALALSTAFWK